MKKRVFAAMISMTAALLLAWTTFPVRAASETGSDSVAGGFLYPSEYAVGKGGYAILYAYRSPDTVVSGIEESLFTDGMKVTGYASGRFPDDTDPAVTVASGTVSLGMVRIFASEGFVIQSVLIRDSVDGQWEDKGAISSYRFQGDENSIAIIFKQIDSSRTEMSADGSSAEDLSAPASSFDGIPSGTSGISSPGQSLRTVMRIALLWFPAALVILAVAVLIIVRFSKHRKRKGIVRGGR